MTDRQEEPATAWVSECNWFPDCPEDHFIGHEREALPAPLDVERLLTACARVGLELFPLQGRAIAAEYGRIAPHAASSPDPIEADYQRFLHPASTEPAQEGER